MNVDEENNDQPGGVPVQNKKDRFKAFLKKRWNRTKAFLKERPAIVISLLLLVVAFQVVFNELDWNAALAALAVLVAAAVFAVLDRTGLFDLIRRVETVGPVGFSAADARAAATGLSGDDQTDEVPGDDEGFRDSMLGYRLELERKMTFVARRIIGAVGPGVVVTGDSNYLTIGGLYSDGLLTREQAKLAASILTWTDDEHKPPKEGGLALNVRKFVKKFRIIVFVEIVRKIARAPEGRDALRVSEEGRRDMNVTSQVTGQWVRLVPVLTLVSGSTLLESVRNRLIDDDLPNDRQLIVIPNGSAAGENATAPRVIYFSELEENLRLMLGEP